MRLASFPRMLLKCCLIASAAIAWVEAAVPDQTLRVAVSAAETSFDPAFAFDTTSAVVTDSIMEPMLDYDYLARPVKLVPRTLAAMPAEEDGGKTYVCKLRKGIFFAPDPAFKGKPRELTAVDYAYGLKRILDPGVKSPWVWMLEGKVVYVGSSLNMPQRVTEHRSNGRSFDRAFYIATIAGEREALERVMIRAIDPSQNRLGRRKVPSVHTATVEVAAC